MLRRAFAGAFMLFTVAACEALVNGDLPAYTCDGTSASACPPMQYCKGAGCAPCEKVDVCDGFDNDCNGKIDDGPESDRDMDSWPSCGVGKMPDCDDSDPTIHPMAMEICNGKDDNCDGRIDEDVCMAPAKCSPKLGKCVMNACDPQNPMSCMSPLVCDPGTLQCVTPGLRKLGDSCTADRECEMGLFCAGSAVLAGKLGAGGTCVKLCCTSNDCPSTFVCYAPGTDGRYCVSAAKLNRGPQGTILAGATSANAAECRSGILGSNGRCADTCCHASDCQAGSSCMFGQLDGKTTVLCTTPFGAGKQDDDCNQHPDCSAGACVSYYNGGYNSCDMPCCGSASCGPLFQSIPFVSHQAFCWDISTQSGDLVALCAQNGGGSASVGAACTSNGNCRSNRCVNNVCSDVCCLDSDCPNPMICRPTDLSGRALRCVMP